ncbi:MAG: phosphodiester glycosidase family protein [Bacteroidales bacterium]|nr:phosphodiester glycosidase family protein [Bacteroidales bacterium]
MKRILITFALLIAGLPVWSIEREKDSLAFVSAEWTFTKLEGGATAMTARMQIFESAQSIAIIKYPARKFRTELIHSPGEMAGKTSEIARREKMLMAMNGSYFNMKQLTPCTYFRIADQVLGETSASESFRVNGVVGIRNRRGHRVKIISCQPSDYNEITERWHSVLAAGPVLMEDKEIVVPEITKSDENGNGTDAFYDKRHPRSAIGYDKKGNIYLIVTDGRHPGDAEGTSIYETALICSFLNLEDAINLDGGGSSTLWRSEEGVLNHPSDNRKFDAQGERKVPNIIGVFR